MPFSPISTALIGYGLAGQAFHAPFLTTLPEFRLQMVMERRSARSRQRYDWVEVVATPEAVWNAPEIELVVIATPSHTHYELASQALNAGKHVVVDKPFALSTQEARTLIELARHQQKLLTVYQNRRWDGGFLTVKQLLKQGLLGHLKSYEAHFDRYRKALRLHSWREAPAPGAGVLYDLGPHLLDQALCLFGWPQTLTANLRREREGAQADDAFTIVLDYASHQATLKAGMLVREAGPHFALHGTEGSFIKYGVDPQEEALRAGISPFSADWGKDLPEAWGKLNTECQGLHFEGKLETLPGDYAAFYRALGASLREGQPLAVLPEQAYLTTWLIELAQQSHQKGQTLKLDPIGQDFWNGQGGSVWPADPS